MTGRRSLLYTVAAAAAACARFGAGQEALYPLDVADVLCAQNSATGEFELRSPRPPIEIDVNIPTSSAQKAKVHVPTFYRTSGAAMTVQLSLMDSSGNIIVPSQSFSLTQVSGRRLSLHNEASGRPGLEKDTQQAQEVGQAPGTNVFHSASENRAAAECEDVFLLDGRAPVDLPDSWAEAREAFRVVCELEFGLGAEDCSSEELNLFQGYPADSSAFNPEAELCKSLVQAVLKQEFGAIALKARRLKSGGGSSGTYSTAGGSPAAGAWTSSSRAGVPDYGYSTARLGSTFPRGYTTTSLGYAGRTSTLPWRGSSRVAVLAGAGVGLGLLGAWRFRNYARSSSGGNVEDGDCEDASSPCQWNLNVTDLVREDLMNFGFYPSKMRYPLKLVIAGVSGADFNNVSSVCPPAGWNASSQVPWEPASDVFFSLVEASNLEENEGDEGGVAAGIVVSLLGLFAFCCCLRFRHRIRTLFKFVNMRKQRCDESPQPGVASAIGSDATIQGSLVFDGKGDPVGVQYNLKISPQSYVTGTGSVGSQDCQISGVVRMDNPNQIAMKLQVTFEASSAEVCFMLFNQGTAWHGAGEFVSKRNGKLLTVSKGILAQLEFCPTPQQEGVQMVVGSIIGLPTAVVAKTE